MGGLPLPRFSMDKLGYKAEMTRLRWDWVLGEPDAVGKQCFTAGIHNAVQGGIVGMGEGVKAILDCRQ